MKKELMKLLKEDKDVRKAIFEIIGSCPQKGETTIGTGRLPSKISAFISPTDGGGQSVREYQARISELTDDIAGKDREIQALKNNLAVLNEENKQLAGRLKNEASRNSGLLRYEEYFGKVMRLYDEFNKLPRDILADFTMVRTSDPFSFAVSLAGFDSIRLYRERIALSYRQYDEKALEELNAVFGMTLEVFGESLGFSLTAAKVGEEYNPRIHSRTSDSSPQGKVAMVIINGYENRATGETEKPLVVVR